MPYGCSEHKFGGEIAHITSMLRDVVIEEGVEGRG